MNMNNAIFSCSFRIFFHPLRFELVTFNNTISRQLEILLAVLIIQLVIIIIENIVLATHSFYLQINLLNNNYILWQNFIVTYYCKKLIDCCL